MSNHNKTIMPEIEYGTPYEDMTSVQKNYFDKVKDSLDKGDLIEIAKNDWYLDYYIESIACDWKTFGLDTLRKRLRNINNQYDNYFAFLYENDCLLGLNRYEEFLENTKINCISEHQLDIIYGLRLCVQNKLGLEADPIDIYCLQYPSKSKIVKSNPELFKEKIIEVFNQYSNRYNGWFDLIHRRFKDLIVPTEHKLLEINITTCAKPRPQLELTVYNYFGLAIGKNGLNSTLKILTTKAENLVRTELGLPKKQVAWTMETFLYDYIKEEFPHIEIIQHGQPLWLDKQHYDIWIPKYKVAIEYQGEQHFKPIKKWGGEEQLKKNIERDERKRKLSIENGVKLFEISSTDNQSNLIENIKAIIDSCTIKD